MAAIVARNAMMATMVRLRIDFARILFGTSVAKGASKAVIVVSIFHGTACGSPQSIRR